MLNLNSGDGRRAAALITHHNRGDREGVSAVLDAATDTGRQLELLFAVLLVYQRLVPELRTPVGAAVLSQAILALATAETNTPTPEPIDPTEEGEDG